MSLRTAAAIAAIASADMPAQAGEPEAGGGREVDLERAFRAGAPQPAPSAKTQMLKGMAAHNAEVESRKERKRAGKAMRKLARSGSTP